MGNHHRFRRPSKKEVVRECGWIGRNGGADDEAPDDEDTDNANGGSLTGKGLTEGRDDHDHELDAI